MSIAAWRSASGVVLDVRKPSVSVMMPVNKAAAIGLVIVKSPVGQVIGKDRGSGNFLCFDQVQFSKFFVGLVMINIDIGLTEIFKDASPYV